jgi:hypothetical protein
MPQLESSDWTTLTVRQSQAFRRADGWVSIGLWTKEIGPIAFEVNQQAIDSLRNNLKTQNDYFTDQSDTHKADKRTSDRSQIGTSKQRR